MGLDVIHDGADNFAIAHRSLSPVIDLLQELNFPLPTARKGL
jgi:hypothetical protein